MGDISEMMLDGTLCEGCGEFIDDEECGHPRLCSVCAAEISDAERRAGKKLAKNTKREKGK